MSEPLIRTEEIIPLWVNAPCPQDSESPDDAVISFARAVEVLVRKRLHQAIMDEAYRGRKEELRRELQELGVPVAPAIEAATRRAHESCPAQVWARAGKPKEFFCERCTEHDADTHGYLWPGHAAIDALAAIARKMREEREAALVVIRGAEAPNPYHDKGLLAVGQELIKRAKERDEARRLHDSHCRGIEHPAGVIRACKPPWRVKP